MFIFLYIYRRGCCAACATSSPWGGEPRVNPWRLQDIVLIRGFCARINHLLLPPPTRISHTIALLLHDYCAIYDPTPTPLVYSIHHTVLVMAISCKAQVNPRNPEFRLPRDYPIHLMYVYVCTLSLSLFICIYTCKSGCCAACTTSSPWGDEPANSQFWSPRDYAGWSSPTEV